jgi:hypothetical protein
MARYRIYYLKESQRQHFRQAAPLPGPLKLKPRDYEPGGDLDAPSPYAAWKLLQERGGERPIGVGDALESDTGALLVCRYVGFEEAHWFVPEPASPPLSPEPPESPARPQ